MSVKNEKVLVDADVILELFLNRSGFVEDIETLLQEAEKNNLTELYITDKCLRRIPLELDEEEIELAEKSVAFIKGIFNDRIIKIDSPLKEQARKYPLPDFDSALELACATKMDLDAIVTHNPSNFGVICENGISKLKIWNLKTLNMRLSLESADEPLQIQQVNGIQLDSPASFLSRIFFHVFSSTGSIIGFASFFSFTNFFSFFTNFLGNHHRPQIIGPSGPSPAEIVYTICKKDGRREARFTPEKRFFGS